MKCVKRILPVAAAVLLTTFAVSCGLGAKESVASESSQVKSAETVGTIRRVFEDDGVYIGSVHKIAGGYDGTKTQYAFMEGEIVYLTEDVYDEDGNPAYCTLISADILKRPKAADTVVKIESLSDDSYIAQIAPFKDGYIHLDYIFKENEETEIFFVKCSRSGKLIAKRSISEINQIPVKEPDRVNILCGEDEIYYLADGRVTVLDEDFNFKKTLVDACYNSACIGPDGIVYFLDDGSGQVSLYNAETDTFTEGFATVDAGFRIYCGGQDELLVNTGSEIKSVNVKNGDVTTLFGLTDVNLPSPVILNIYRDEQDKLQIIFSETEATAREMPDGSTKETLDMALFIDSIKRYDKADAPEEDVIKIAMCYPDITVRAAANEYMLAHPDIKVKLKTYMNSNSNYDEVYNQIDKDILDGKGYDIWITSGLDISKYSSKGLFEDLMPYIEDDSSFDMSRYYKNILLCTREEDGKIYSLTSKASLSAFVGDRSVFGAKEALSTDDIIEARKRYSDIPFFGESMSTQVLNAFLNGDYRTFIDTKDGKMNFETDGFKKVLEFAATYPYMTDKEYRDYLRSTRGDRSGIKVFLAYYTNTLSFMKNKLELGDNLKVYKIDSKEGNAYFAAPEEAYSVCADSIHKEEAWELIKTFLDSDADSTGIDFRVNKELFEKDWGNTYAHYKDGADYMLGDTKGYLVISKDDYESLIEMMETAKPFVDIGPVIKDIVTEEASYFFAKEKTLEDAVAVIQSRVNLYLAEKR